MVDNNRINNLRLILKLVDTFIFPFFKLATYNICNTITPTYLYKWVLFVRKNAITV